VSGEAQPIPDVRAKLEQLRVRRRVTAFCDACGKTRSWFYKVLRGEASLLPYLVQLDYALDFPAHPITAAREAAGLSRTEAARRLGLSRQTIYVWETQPARPERVEAMLSLKRSE